MLTSEIELDNHNFGLTKRTAGFSLPIQHLLRPRISALPSRPSPQAALWGVLEFASQLLSLSDQNCNYRKMRPNPRWAAWAASTPTPFRFSILLAFSPLSFFFFFSYPASVSLIFPPYLFLCLSLILSHSLSLCITVCLCLSLYISVCFCLSSISISLFFSLQGRAHNFWLTHEVPSPSRRLQSRTTGRPVVFPNSHIQLMISKD